MVVAPTCSDQVLQAAAWLIELCGVMLMVLELRIARMSGITVVERINRNWMAKVGFWSRDQNGWHASYRSLALDALISRRIASIFSACFYMIAAN